MLLVFIVAALSACGSQEQARKRQVRIPEEILLTPTRFITDTPAPPTPIPTVTPTAEPTPIRSLKRTSRAKLPPERIVAPGIGLNASVVSMDWKNIVQNGSQFTEWAVPANAAGFQTGSALPGQAGNTVISGHHNIDGKVFKQLHELTPGDAIYVHTAEDIFQYIVHESFLLRELGVSVEQKYQNAQWIGPTGDERLTLVTCWPVTGNAYRLIVIAKPYFANGS